jgi:hypothetical protein
VLANTRYFKPLLNGYSGFHPASFMERGRALEGFPDECAIAELRSAQVTTVVVHVAAFNDWYGSDRLEAVEASAALELVAEDEGIRLYRVR